MKVSLKSWLMLVIRLILFTVIQAIFAWIFYLSGNPKAWEASANWWMLVVSIANGICLLLLIRFFKEQGRKYWDLFRIQRPFIKQDLLALLVVFLISAPVSFLPNILLGTWLFGDSAQTLALIVRPLPVWAVYLSILLFPVTQGLVEIATYFGYVMPQFEKQGMRSWLAYTLPSVFLGLQHIAVPLLMDGRFILWRALMFLPFAFLVGAVMKWRPRMLPYLAVLHILMDLSLPFMFLSSAY